MQAILETLRPKQWIKNLVIFAGLVFDGQLLNLQPFLRVLFATLIFCLISGLTYTVNDLFDIKADRLHPQKKNRPIASGRLSVQRAILLAVILALIAFPAAFLLSIEFGWVCLTYTLLILAYSKWLKKILILDVMIIAFGFRFTRNRRRGGDYGKLFLTMAVPHHHLARDLFRFWQTPLRAEDVRNPCQRAP